MIGSHKNAQVTLPTTADTGILDPQPVAILERRLVKRGNKPAAMVLVQWENGTAQEATWENWEKLTKLYPNFNP